MAADVPDAPEEDVQVSPCCQVWKNKYSKAEKGRICLKQAVRLLEKGCDDIQAQNLTLKKAYEEEQARAKVEKEGREKESALRVSLENELCALKSEISNLKQKGVSDAEDKTDEMKLLKAIVSDREKEINWLKELVEKEKKRADLEKKNAAAEKRKAAEASKDAETEKGKGSEERRLADIERKKAEDYRTQLEALRKEVNEAKSKLVSEKSKFDKATKQLQEEKKKTVEQRKRADLYMAKAEEQRKIAEETMKKAAEARKRADLEIDQAEEQRKIAEETKKKAVEARKHADMEMAKVEEKRKLAEETKKKGKLAEETKKKAVEERKHADMEIAKAEEQRKLAEETKKKAVEERKRANLEVANVGEQKKIAEATKEAVEEKLHADNLFKQLEEARRRNGELEKKLHELSGSRNLVEGPFDQPDRKTSAEAATKKTAELEVLMKDADKSKAVSKLLHSEEVEKEKAIFERKRADSEMRKAEKKRKLVEENTKKAMEEKLRADHLLKQLEDARLKIDELKKQMNELSSSRKTVDALVFSSDKGISAEVAKVKLLKKQLKFEKQRVKHAKDVAKLEKSRSNLLQQKVGCMKLELVQFINRFDALDKCFSTPTEGIDDMEKAGDFSSMQWLKVKENLRSLNFCQTCLQTENQLLKTMCMDTTPSNPLGETFQHDAHLLPIQGGNCAESITGINSKLESLLGGSNRKMLQSSAINSSTASFSDRQLVGSQERGAFSVTTSAKLGEEILNVEQTVSGISGEVTKNRCNENVAVVAENSVRSPLPVDPLGRVNGCGKKRKRILNAVESIELLCFESKKLHLQLEDKLSALHGVVRGQMDKPTEEAKLLRSNLQDIAYAVHDRSHKKRKTSHEETVAMQQSCDGLQLTQMQNSLEPLEDANVFRPASQPANNLMNSTKVSGEAICDPHTIDPKIMVGFKEVVNGNYMKLLDLDDAVEEECYRMAADMPVSPTLPEIEFPGVETFQVDQFTHTHDENCEGFSHEDENVASSDSFDVINMEKGSNKLPCNRADTSLKVLQHENECSHGTIDIPRSNENGICSTMPAGRACLSHPQNSGVFERIPKYCVVFSDIKDASSISRIFFATKSCMAQCSLPAQTEFVVHRILHALKLEENLLAKEKVCVFFSLVLLNLCTATSGKCSLIRDLIPCLHLFAEHINAVMSDAEPRSVVAELCLDELLSVIEDFLIEGRILFYTDLSSESSSECDSRIHVTVDGSDVILLHEAASADLLVAGSIILGSICAAADRTGFMCEAVYNIFRMHRYDISVALLVLHVFAYVGGDKIFTSRKYSLTMTVLKSIVVFLEREHAPVATVTLSLVAEVQAECHACVGCPFSKDVLSVDIVVSLLFEKLQNYVQSGIMHQEVTANSSNSNVMSIQDKTEQNLGCVVDMNCDVSCCLDKYSVPGKQSGSFVAGTLCHISDVLSLIELLACNMSWVWTCEKIIAQLLSMLESPGLENLTLAIIILLGQLGRLGVDAVGYEDKEVENLRVKLSAFLFRETTIRAGLPIQLATVSALLGLISLDIEKVIQKNVTLPVMSGQFVHADLIRNWFPLLTEEQRAMSIRLFQSVD
ncbi:Maternal effect embryo arrest 22, putative [Theobroma cacao]|uniref:Maternal effect embryo arrest 22, putative n=1 Tax=Theobroma cacao TaxID=3641 RepID=A0A061G820_THECC|nr:Maternal effect embryo arrest 22, putative [Theobroma cacao]